MPDPLLLNGDRPLVLFPVRLETRFFGQELRIRVFPDKIHVDTHEPELTADEVEWANTFTRCSGTRRRKKRESTRGNNLRTGMAQNARRGSRAS